MDKFDRKNYSVLNSRLIAQHPCFTCIYSRFVCSIIFNCHSLALSSYPMFGPPKSTSSPQTLIYGFGRFIQFFTHQRCRHQFGAAYLTGLSLNLVVFVICSYFCHWTWSYPYLSAALPIALHGCWWNVNLPGSSLAILNFFLQSVVCHLYSLRPTWSDVLKHISI